MKDRDFLWCALNLMLDDEEELNALCPTCRNRAMEQRCTVCSSPLFMAGGEVNPAFDNARFERIKRGEGK